MATIDMDKSEMIVNIFHSDELKIDFNPKMNRLSIHNERKSWISCSSTSFQLLIVLMKSGGCYEKVVVDQLSSTLEILKIGGNFSLKFESSRNLSF